MAVPESQLETWSHQGSVALSKATHETIRNVLDERDSPYRSRSFTTFLQGSYGNDTNVYRDSDVDIVMRLDGTYYYDINALSEGSKERFQKAFSAAQYGYGEFKTDVLSWLRASYGTAVSAGTKAISIAGANSRRDADVLPCAKYRLYRADSDGQDERYHDGVFFIRTDGVRIANFPKQHAENCTAKHKATASWFKPTVRVLKNIRNRMVDEKVIADGVAPSYFIEGMLWNVPDRFFGGSYGQTIVAAINWVKGADRAQLSCANGLHWLVRDSSPVGWSEANFETYLGALIKYWNEWDS